MKNTWTIESPAPADLDDIETAIINGKVFVRIREGQVVTHLQPAAKFVATASLAEQMASVRREFREVMDAYGDGDDDALAEELVDLQISCETALAIMGRDANQVREMVYHKNRIRGYFDAMGMSFEEARTSLQEALQAFSKAMGRAIAQVFGSGPCSSCGNYPCLRSTLLGSEPCPDWSPRGGGQG